MSTNLGRILTAVTPWFVAFACQAPFLILSCAGCIETHSHISLTLHSEFGVVASIDGNQHFLRLSTCCHDSSPPRMRDNTPKNCGICATCTSINKLVPNAVPQILSLPLWRVGQRPTCQRAQNSFNRRVCTHGLYILHIAHPTTKTFTFHETENGMCGRSLQFMATQNFCDGKTGDSLSTINRRVESTKFAPVLQQAPFTSFAYK